MLETELSDPWFWAALRRFATLGDCACNGRGPVSLQVNWPPLAEVQIQGTVPTYDATTVCDPALSAAVVMDALALNPVAGESATVPSDDPSTSKFTDPLRGPVQEPQSAG